jgi:uncharacterized protein YndB with AHSA1/START domain
MNTVTDRIEKKILLKAPRSRVWKALTDAGQFGEWFGVSLEGEGTFRPGQAMTGRITSPGYEHIEMHAVVEAVEPERRFSWRWHPGEPDPAVDYTSEPMTLVEFDLEEVEGGTLLTVVETGFDSIPASRRAEVFRANDGGWAEQLVNIERFLEKAA